MVTAFACGVMPAAAQADTDRAPADSAAVSAPAESLAPVASSAHADSAAIRAPVGRPGLPDRGARAWQLGLARPDRLHHVSLALTVGLGAGLISHRSAGAAAGSIACGVAKELYDIPRQGFDIVDLLADVIGGVAATAITAALLD